METRGQAQFVGLDFVEFKLSASNSAAIPEQFLDLEPEPDRNLDKNNMLCLVHVVVSRGVTIPKIQ